MSQLGMGVMINMLGGNKETVEALKSSIGKTVSSVELKDDALQFIFKDKTKLRLWDDGQSCCESRYMTTDDSLTRFKGSKFLDVELKEAPEIPDEYGSHEVQFLRVKTSKGDITVETHNVNNGYYGGFYIKAATE